MQRLGHGRPRLGRRLWGLGAVTLFGLGALALPAAATTPRAAGVPGNAVTAADAHITAEVAAPNVSDANTDTNTDANTDTADPGWTLDEAKAAVQDAVISRVPGAAARVDTDAIKGALRGTSIRLVMLPFSPLHDDARDAAGMQGVDLRSWADDQGIDLIQVRGLQVSMDIFDVTVDSMGEVEPVLAHMDVTAQVQFAIYWLKNHEKSADAGSPTPLPEQRPADAAQVDAIADALAVNSIYNDPALDRAQQIEGWDAGDGLRVRAAFLPPAPQGTELRDLITPLHQHFRDDLVVVMRGRWMEVAGPDEDILNSSRLWAYGYYSRPVLGWQIQPSALVRLFSERVALLRTGVVTDQQTPAEPRDPVTSVSNALPWIFGGVALVIVAAVTAFRAFGSRTAQSGNAGDAEQSTFDRRALGVRLATIAGQAVAIEPLIHGHFARKNFSIVMERYRVACEALASDGSVQIVAVVVAEAEKHLKVVASKLGVPLAEPVETLGLTS